MIARGVETLKRQRPEWSPWLALVEEALRETKEGDWDASVPTPNPAGDRATSLLAGTTVIVDGTAVHRLFKRLIDIAARAALPKMATLETLRGREVDLPALFRASICLDTEHISHLAETSGADAEALQGVVALVSMPFLQACRRRWSSLSSSAWVAGYCPVCASWPAFAESRGIERSRHFRCGRCGSEWYSQLLRCAYCGNADHDDLATLVPDAPGASGAVEACHRCHGYVKVFTTLQGYAPESIMLEDLASVELDLAALAQGYTRPSGPGGPVGVSVKVASPSRRLFAWRA